MRGAGWKLVCFDLDDTLIREVHSVMLPCILNGMDVLACFVPRQEEDGRGGQI